MEKERLASVLLRIGIALTFLYASYSSLTNPTSWVGFVPDFVGNFIQVNLFLELFSYFQIALSVWLLSGYKMFYSGIVTVLVTLPIVILNPIQMDIVFRDITIIFAGLALTTLNES